MTTYERTPLCELAEKHLTDKSMKFNRYSYFYNKAIRESMNRDEVIRVGEIGIGHLDCMCHVSWDYKPGASLRMWEEYFPNAKVYGFDYDERTLFTEGRIECIFADQSTQENLHTAFSKCGGLFDLIVDDGSHYPPHQLNTRAVAPEYIRPGGLLIIEDVKREVLEEWMEEPPPGFETICINPEDNKVSSFVIYRKLK